MFMGLFWLQNGREVLSSASQVGNIYEYLYVWIYSIRILHWTLDRCNVHWAVDIGQWSLDSGHWTVGRRMKWRSSLPAYKLSTACRVDCSRHLISIFIKQAEKRTSWEGHKLCTKLTWWHDYMMSHRWHDDMMAWLRAKMPQVRKFDWLTYSQG